MLILRYPGGLKKAVTLSYDDGVEQDARLMDILDRHGLKATFNLNSGCWTEEGHVFPEGFVQRRLTLKAAQALYTHSGHEVASHTLTHPYLTQLPPAMAGAEIAQDRLNLERQFGVLVRGAAYPFGVYSDAIVETLRANGIVYCRTVESSHGFAIPSDWLRLRPTCHHADPALMELCEQFLDRPSAKYSELFYLWGHAYEFEDKDNWEVIERFAAFMGHREGIWYATNIEICDYVLDFQRLILSADGRTLVNPTARTLWLQPDVDCEALAIAPGETVHI